MLYHFLGFFKSYPPQKQIGEYLGVPSFAGC